jgi:hypothetical protein
MSKKRTFPLRLVTCVALLTTLVCTPSLGELSPVGTWRLGNVKGTLQLDKHHSFLLTYYTKTLVDLELRGAWKINGVSLILVPEQVRQNEVAVKATGFPSALKGTVSVASDGSRVLHLERDDYLFVSDRATVPDPWEISPLPKKDAIDAPPFITVSRGILTGLRLLPSADVQCETNTAEEVEITITGNARVTGFGKLAIWQEGQTNYFWIVDLRHRGRSINFVYGEPKNDKARQLHPTDAQGKPKSLSRHKRFFIRVDVSYKLMMPPSLGADPMYFGFEYADDGSIRRLGGLKQSDLKEPIQAWPQQHPAPYHQPRKSAVEER